VCVCVCRYGCECGALLVGKATMVTLCFKSLQVVSTPVLVWKNSGTTFLQKQLAEQTTNTQLHPHTPLAQLATHSLLTHTHTHTHTRRYIYPRNAKQLVRSFSRLRIPMSPNRAHPVACTHTPLDTWLLPGSLSHRACTTVRRPTPPTQKPNQHTATQIAAHPFSFPPSLHPSISPPSLTVPCCSLLFLIVPY